MKHFSFFTLIILIFCCTVSFANDDIISSGGTVDADGTLTSCEVGADGLIVVPFEINGVKVKKIGDGVFKGVEAGSVYIEEGIEEIGNEAFSESTIDYVDFSSSVKKIGDYAFKNCSNLTSFSAYSGDIVFGKEALYGTGYLHISVPCTADLLSLHDNIADAKGDDDFTFDIMHTGLVPSMVEKDMFGHSMIMCEDCGFKGSVYLDNIVLPFEDVSNDAWYYPYVSTAYEFGILKGKSETIFDPNANMTLAEAAKIAACIHMYYTDEAYNFETENGKWYEPYVKYCYDNKIVDVHVTFDWEKTATRSEMAYLFSRADTGEYEPNPDVPLTDIPDVDDKTSFAENILALYRRGIATGSDEYYAFCPDAYVKRSEAATFISRIICYDMRVDLPKG